MGKISLSLFFPSILQSIVRRKIAILLVAELRKQRKLDRKNNAALIIQVFLFFGIFYNDFFLSVPVFIS